MSDESALAPSHWVDRSEIGDLPAPKRIWLRNVHALGAVMFARRDGPPADARLNWLCREVERLNGAMRGQPNLVFKASLFAVSVFAPLLIFRLPPFRRLKFGTRVRALERFERSIFGMTLFALKAIMCIIWFEHPEEARAIGFDGSCLASTHDVDPPALEVVVADNDVGSAAVPTGGVTG